MSFPTLEDQWSLISRGVEEIIPEDELKKKISKSSENNKPLKIKLGCDPSRPDSVSYTHLTLPTTPYV